MNKSDFTDIETIITTTRKRGNLIQLAEMASKVSGAVVTTSVLGNTRICLTGANKRTVYPVHLAALALNEIKGPVFFDAELVKEMAKALISQSVEIERLRGTTIQPAIHQIQQEITVADPEESDAARIAREMDNMMKDLSRLENELNSLQHQ